MDRNLLINIRQLLFSAHGQIGRKIFILGLLAVVMFIMLGNSLLRHLGPGSMAGFYFARVFPFLMLYFLYCLYSKRLRDMGRGSRWFFLMLTLEVFAIIIVMLVFGGAEYFSEFSAYSRDETIDPELSNVIIETYQNRLMANNHIIRPLLWVVPIIFTIWTALTPSKLKDDAKRA